MHTDFENHTMRRLLRRAMKGRKHGHAYGRPHGHGHGLHRGAMKGPGRHWAGPDGTFDGPFGPGPFDPGHRGGGRGRGGEGRGNEGGGGPGRRRMFRTGELRLVLLHLVSQQPRHGYDLIKAIEELTGGAYAPSPGTVYPTLQLMVDEGTLAEMPDESARKVFAITPAGTAALEQDKVLAEAALARLSTLGEERRSGPHRQIQRAMENLRNALQHQRAAGIDQARVEQIVDLIDEAARRIERL